MFRWKTIGWVWVVLALWGVGLMPAHAQTGSFEAWLYEATTGEMIRIDQTGELERLTLPLPDGYDIYPYGGVAVSPDGQMFAYTAGKNASFQAELVIYNARTRSIMATYPPSNSAYTSFDLNPTAAFSPDGRQLAFGYSFDGEAGGWELIVINLDSFSLGGTLTSADPVMGGVYDGFGLTPVPTYFRPDGQVAFALVQAGTDGGGAGYDAYLWDIQDGIVTPTRGYSSLSYDIFTPTGEVILSRADSRFPATATDALPFGQQQVLSYYDSTSGVLTPFYTDPTITLFNPTFVMNGAHILVSVYDGLTSEEYRLIGRDGNAMGALTIAPAPYDVAGTRDGFLYAQYIGTSPAFFNIDLRDGAIDFNETESALLIGTSQTSPRIVWVGDSDPLTPYFTTENYTRWGAIGVAEADSDLGGGTAGSTGVGRDSLTVGGQATIRTTDGDALNVRSGPGTGFAIVVRATPGTTVTLIEGPQAADGYQWWRIRLPNGQEGWAVDSADNELTLIPGAGSFTPPPATQAANPSIGSALQVGDAAYVLLGGGIDALRLRNQPSTSGGVVQLMPNATPVTVIGGPTNADGFTWWQLRTPDGNVGWAAEVVGNQRVLQKGSPPVSPTAVPGVAPTIAPVTTPDP